MKIPSIKPIWLATIGLLTALGVALKLALAIPAFTPQSQPVGYVAQDEMTSYDLRDGKQILFRAEYGTEYWDGNLLAYALNSEANLAIATQPWSGGAAHAIDTQGSDRFIVTRKDDGTKIAFNWGSLSAAQKNSLDSASAALASSPILDYLRGDRSKEIQRPLGIYRQRASALGDIIHSRPYYVADATNPTIFVGSNDGMLHAIDAANGEERWAYVPSMLISKMKNLTTNPYVHDYFVDGSPVVAKISSGSQRILTGALGAGGKGLYALDITGSSRLAPASEAAAATNILWEITPASSGFGNLGYTYSNPGIAKVGGTDAVIVGNGYNNAGDYQAYLYVINAASGSQISAIKAGTSGTVGSPNGLSTPVAIDTNADGNVDLVYAGDLNGTMWKFNLSAGTATALLVTSPAQPITMTPGVALHPNGGYMVDFATGSMLTAADASDTATFAAYGIWDGAPATNTALLTQTLTERCYTPGATVAAVPCASPVRTVSSLQPDWTAYTSGATQHHKGWKTPLPAGEKVIGDGSFIENGRFYFTAFNPTTSTLVETTTVKGQNWLMELDYLTGGVKSVPFLDLSGDHIITDDDRVKDPVTHAIVTGTDGIPVGKFLSIGLLSQPILVQLSVLNNTLFNKNPDITIVPVVLPAGTGVAGGHFDVDNYYGAPSAAAGCVGTACKTGKHYHQYDDKFDVTGVNFLNPSSVNMNINQGVTSTTTNFKVVASNQYLSPAVKLHIGNAAGYTYNLDSGYIALKTYTTGATLSLATLQTYRRGAIAWTQAGATSTPAELAAPKNIGSFAFNMPVDALSAKDWWGNGDVRVGLHPTETGCVNKAKSANDGNMYQPVIPPANGVDGPGTNGWSGSTTPATATGVRHNGALTLQVIKDTTPDSAMELSVAGRPEYGWRVKSSLASTYLLEEFTVFWHHPDNGCYGDAGWKKAPGPDNGSSTADTKLAGSTDPKIGSLGGAGIGGTATIVGTDTSVGGNVTTTTISYSDGTTATIVRTANDDGTVTIVTTDALGTETTQTIANTDGSNLSGGDERGLQSKTGRVSWRELVPQ